MYPAALISFAPLRTALVWSWKHSSMARRWTNVVLWVRRFKRQSGAL